MTRKKKIWVPIVIILILAAITTAVILVVVHNRNSEAVEVYPVSTMYDTYWGDSTTLSATVSDGRIQNVALREGLVETINVSEGDPVQAGDVLMVYDATSFQLTLQSDNAAIAVLESNLSTARSNLATYKILKPSESAPEPTEIIIHHTVDPVSTLSNIAAGATPSEGDPGSGLVYNCTADTVVTAACLQWLADNGYTAEFRIYQDNILYASWIVDGSELSTSSSNTADTPDPGTSDPAASDPASSDSDVSDPAASDPAASDAGASDPAATDSDTDDPAAQDPDANPVSSANPAYTGFSNWVVGDGLEFYGDGTVSVDCSVAHYGTLMTVVPEEGEWDEITYQENFTYDSLGNYAYTKAELANMISEEEAEIQSLELDLKSAELRLQQDQLIAENGEVTATIDGIVTKVGEVAATEAGDTLITVKGNENYTITVYVGELDLPAISIGDSISAYCYESGNYVTATILEIGSQPVSGDYSYGYYNENVSYYPVNATVDDPDVELTIGEWCEATLMADEEEETGIYLPLMYVRSDEAGSYVMCVGDDGRLAKQYVITGKTLWGYEIEIKGGISLDDYIAFPYGTAVREGAPVIYSESTDYWG